MLRILVLPIIALAIVIGAMTPSASAQSQTKPAGPDAKGCENALEKIDAGSRKYEEVAKRYFKLLDQMNAETKARKAPGIDVKYCSLLREVVSDYDKNKAQIDDAVVTGRDLCAGKTQSLAVLDAATLVTAGDDMMLARSIVAQCKLKGK